MNHEEWSTAVIPKVTGTWNLHRIFGDKNESGLDFFILMSSIGGLRGSPGQSNYAAANTFLNAFSEYRHSMGLPASVINLGVVEEVGFVARTPLAIERYQSQGAQTLGQQEVLDVMHLAIVNKHPSQSSDRNITQLNPGVITKQTNERKPFRDDVSIRLLHSQNSASQNTANSSDIDNKLKEFLSLAASDSSVLSHPSSLELLINEIRRLFASLLSLPEQDFDVTKPIASLGVDSLISTEIRRWWRRHLGLEISVLKITNAGSVTQLGESALKELGDRFRQ